MAGNQDKSFGEKIQSLIDQLLDTKGVDLGIFGMLIDKLIGFVGDIQKPLEQGEDNSLSGYESNARNFLNLINPEMVKAQLNLKNKPNAAEADRKAFELITKAKEDIEKTLSEIRIEESVIISPVIKNPDAIDISEISFAVKEQQRINSEKTAEQIQKDEEKKSAVPPVKKDELISRQPEKNKQKEEIHPEKGPDFIPVEINAPGREKIKCDPKDEFSVSDAVPKELKVGGDIRQLETFIRNNKQLDQKDLNYLNRRIATEKFYNHLEEHKQKSEPKGPVTNPETGEIRLEHLSQDSFQTTANGCYSCSMEMLLKSRGVNINQQEIRAFRAKGFENDKLADARMLSDQVGSIMEIGGIITRALPNTALLEKKYTRKPDEVLDKDNFNAVANDIRGTVIKALSQDKSPVSMNFDKHYMTIIGFDPQKDELIYKDSYHYEDSKENDFNKDNRISVKDLVKKGTFGLTQLVDINPENPNRAAENIYGLEYINNRFMLNTGNSIGIRKDGQYNPKTDGDMHSVYSQAGEAFVVNTTMKVPTKLVPTANMIEGVVKAEVIKTAKNDPRKKALLEKIESRRKELTEPKTGTPSKSDYAKSVYYERIASGINQMTPWQVQHALDPKAIAENISNIMQLNEFNDVYSKLGQSEAVSYAGFNKQMKTLAGSNAKSNNKKEKGSILENAIKKNNERIVNQELAKQKLKNDTLKKDKIIENPQIQNPVKDFTLPSK